MMRTLRHIEDREHRQEMLQWIRHEFIKHKETRDEVHNYDVVPS